MGHDTSASFSESYKAAGVDITAGYEAVRRMGTHVARTRTPGVLSPIGGFGGLFQPDFSGIKKPVLAGGTDGVGTKLKLAFMMNKHDTVGIDCVAMCVNDIICSGARPLFFLDYIALGKNDPARVEAIVSGVAEGCVQANAALIGGETAEMPGFYPDNEYDLAGFAVGLADQEKLLDPARAKAGDILIALASSGAHSNGFSLIRKVFELERRPDRLSRHYDELGGTLGEALLTPTRIYVKSILTLMQQVTIHSLAHITGGGFYENIPRFLPEGLHARIDLQALRIPVLFDLIQAAGDISDHDMFNTFNMGVGMCAAVPADQVDAALTLLNSMGEEAYIIGELVSAQRGVTLC